MADEEELFDLWKTGVLTEAQYKLLSSDQGASVIQGSKIDGDVDVGGHMAGRDLTVVEHADTVVTAPSPEETHKNQVAAQRDLYLNSLQNWCNALPLSALGDGSQKKRTLAQVYTALDTKTQIKADDQPHDDPEVKLQPLPAMQAAIDSSRMVLLGAPGSGKSSFVMHLAAMVAQKDPALPSSWHRLLPLFVRLRDIAPALNQLKIANEETLTDKEQKALRDVLFNRWQEELRERYAPLLADDLGKLFNKGGIMLVFDGLDEVPEATRQRAVHAVTAAIDEHKNCTHVFVTCRVRSYTDKIRLKQFTHHTLADFDQDKIKLFVEAWYAAQDQLQEKEKRQRVQDLQQAALGNDLSDMAKNPMLLTTMAIIHQKNTQLPKGRVRVYNEAVTTLLQRWQTGKGLPVSAALKDVIDDDGQLRRIVERIAYEAHLLQEGSAEQDKKRSADISRGSLLDLLDDSVYLGDLALVGEFLDYIDMRAGLLVGYGGAHREKPAYYGFPHRTFQEYLAGCYLVSLPDVDGTYLKKMKAGDYWYLAGQLGIEEWVHVRRADVQARKLAYALCPFSPPKTAVHWRALLLSGHAALALGKPKIEQDEAQDGGAVYWKRLWERIASALHSPLPLLERVEASNLLLKMGDKRVGVGLTGKLPDIALCYVARGPFMMGSGDADRDAQDHEKPLHELDIPYDFWIGQYPVTVAQWRAFCESGHKMRNKSSLADPDNHPVRRVSWDEAIVFCEWLTAQFEHLLPDGYIVTLPSEAEWEKAARGGLRISERAHVTRLTSGEVSTVPTGLATIKNTMPERKRPWGDAISADDANGKASELNTTCAAGIFAGNESPYGAIDMVGNVWEWTRSIWGSSYSDPIPYPYQISKAREDVELRRAIRVLRGGSLASNNSRLRCAARAQGYQSRGYSRNGFRVCVRPHFPSHSEP